MLTPTTVVVMGVSGSGKTTVARALAARLGTVMQEGDDLHPAANVARLRAGHPLGDDDRRPWLAAVATWIGEHERAPAVITCSALKRRYRDVLRAGHPSVWFAHVSTDPAVLRARLEQRRGHWMPPSLLDSQLADLEPLEPDEPGETVDAGGTPGDVVGAVLVALARDRPDSLLP